MKLSRGTSCWAAFASLLVLGVAASARADDRVERSAPSSAQRPSWDEIEAELLPGQAQAADAGRAELIDRKVPAVGEASKPLQNRDREKQPIQRGTTTTTNGGSWARTTLSLVAVVSLALLLAWGYRSAAMGANPLTPRGRSGGLIQVIGRQSISPRHAVCLVRVGPRLVLVGQSQDRLTQLDVIEDAALVSQLVGESGLAAERRDAAVFQRQLESEAAEYARSVPRAESTPIQRELQRMQTVLKQTVRSTAASES